MWYIGQRIVSVKTGPAFKKDDEFVIKGLKPDCCGPGLDILVDGVKDTHCSNCKKLLGGSWFHESCFSPLQSFGEEVTERISQQMEVEV